jgi:hypothetical protein
VLKGDRVRLVKDVHNGVLAKGATGVVVFTFFDGSADVLLDKPALGDEYPESPWLLKEDEVERLEEE